jgi:hypothetical protein
VPKETKKVKLNPLGTCAIKGHWNQEQLPLVVKNLCKKYPNITYMEIRPYEIHFTFEMSFDQLVRKQAGKKREFKLENPSKRKARKVPDSIRSDEPCQKMANP